MGYTTDFQTIYQAVIDAIVATSTFTTTNTTGAYMKDWTGISYPVCMVRPMKDTLISTELGGILEIREARFKVTIKNSGTGTKTDQDTIIGYVGEIIDYLRDHRDLGVTIAGVDANDADIDYSLSESRSAIFYYAILIIRVTYHRAT